jgi:hypothetical protein
MAEQSMIDYTRLGRVFIMYWIHNTCSGEADVNRVIIFSYLVCFIHCFQ